MSENKKKKQTETAPLIATIIVAVLAMAAVIVLLITINIADKNKQEDNTPAVTTQQFSEVFVQDCVTTAQDLLRENLTIIRLFVSEGLPHYDEPYGNEPEDGIFTVNSGDYTSLEAIESLVKSVYTNSATESIMNLGVYRNRKVLVDIVYEDTTKEAATTEDRPLYEEKEVLGISAAFTPDPSVYEDWEGFSAIAVTPKSETECELTISVGGTDDGSVAPIKTIETAMVKIEGEWKLASFVY